MINFNETTLGADNDDDALTETEKITPVITLDCDIKSDGLFSGLVHDENFDLGYNIIKVNDWTYENATTYVDDSTNSFEVPTQTEFDDFTDISYERHNEISIFARSLLSAPSSYYNVEANFLGPQVVIDCFFCDNQDCWSGGGGSTDFDQYETAPSMKIEFKDYIEATGNPEIKVYTNVPMDDIEKAKKNEPQYIKAFNSEGIVTHVKFINLKANTEFNIQGLAEIPFNFGSFIFGFLISTVAIVLIRKRWKK